MSTYNKYNMSNKINKIPTKVVREYSKANNHMTWDEYFLNVLDSISARATCNRGRAACIFVRDNIILSTGYVGAPRGFDDCDHAGHLIETTKHLDGREVEHCVRTVHAEQNAICNAALNGISLKGCTVYVSFTPCRVCAMMLVQLQTTRVVCNQKHSMATVGDEILRQAGIKVEYITTQQIKY